MRKRNNNGNTNEDIGQKKLLELTDLLNHTHFHDFSSGLV